jgi:RimJ/RimL family protein N-acetyltransferase
VPEPVVLAGRVARLEPLALHHLAGLTDAAHESRNTYGFTLVPDGADAMSAYVDAALADQATGAALPFAVRDVARDRIVGSTRFLDLDYWTWPPARPSVHPPVMPGDVPSTAEIGSTWLASSAQRTGINTECKYLLLRHAFDDWRLHRITFKTDARNERSRRAIERIGAQFEGVRRAHTVASDGTIRDSAYYSIVRSEWPEIARHLCTLMARPPGTR